MDSPLDEALRKYDAEQSRREEERAKEEVKRAARRERLIVLVSDFVSRMNKVGNPGTYDWKEGWFRKIKVWSLRYESGDSYAGITLAVDGRIPKLVDSDRVRRGRRRASGSHFEFRPFSEFDRDLSDRELESLAKSMAEMLRLAVN